jgi:protein-L-isoaspartate O-methyltransferase
VIPIGEINQVQWLFRLTKDADGTVREEKVLPVSFVPLLN